MDHVEDLVALTQQLQQIMDDHQHPVAVEPTIWEQAVNEWRYLTHLVWEASGHHLSFETLPWVPENIDRVWYGYWYRDAPDCDEETLHKHFQNHHKNSDRYLLRVEFNWDSPTHLYGAIAFSFRKSSPAADTFTHYWKLTWTGSQWMVSPQHTSPQSLSEPLTATWLLSQVVEFFHRWTPSKPHNQYIYEMTSPLPNQKWWTRRKSRPTA